jgi:hypothetical protein
MLTQILFLFVLETRLVGWNTWKTAQILELQNYSENTPIKRLLQNLIV